MAYPQVIVEVQFTAGVWTDISSYVYEVHTNRGRNSQLDRMEAGTCDLILNNKDRRFDPSNTSSPYYPNVVPVRPIRVRALWSASYYPRFQGFVEDWTPRWRGRHGEVEVRCVDAFEWLSLRKLGNPFALEMMEDSPRAFWRLNENSGPTAIDSSGNGYNGTYVGSPTFSQSDPITDGEDGAVQFPFNAYVDAGTGPAIVGTGAFTVELFFKALGGAAAYNFFQQNPFGAIYSINIQMQADGDLVFWTERSGLDSTVVTSGVNFRDGNWHHLVCRRSAGGTMTIVVDKVERVSSALTIRDLSVGSIKFGGLSSDVPTTFVMDEVALYNTEVSKARTDAHYDATGAWGGQLSGTRVTSVLDMVNWSASDRAIDAGRSTLQSAPDLDAQSALEHLLDVAQTENGALYMTRDGKVKFRQRLNLSSTASYTFGDAGGAELPYVDVVPVYSKDLIRNHVQVTRKDGNTSSASDTTSIAAYLERFYSKSSIANTDTEAQNDALWTLAHYKDPILQFKELVVDPANDEAALWPAVLTLELEDLLRLFRRPPGGGSTIDQSTYIQRIKEDIGPGQKWIVTYGLSPAEVQVYWQLGVVGFSELGTTTRLAY